ncbi:MAG: hypothetical protein AABY16_01425 [Nanoarchaeota archaeon]
MNKKAQILWGWALISLALAISAYSNSQCSFSCEGIYGNMLNPLSITGIILYIIGTILLFKSLK